MRSQQSLRRRRAHGAAFAVLAMLLAGASGLGCGGDELSDHIEKGLAFYAAGSFEDAQLEGLYVLLRDPDNEDALRLVARSLLAQDRDGEAEGYFRQLNAQNPLYAIEAARLYEARARQDYESGERSRAARRWTTALSFEPRLDLGPYAFFMAGRAYEQDDFELAADLFGDAIAAFPDSSAVRDATFAYGRSLHNLERRREAMAVLEPFIKGYPRHPRRPEAIYLYQEMLIHEAAAANGRMDYEGAVGYLRKALRYRDNPPMTARALLELGDSYENLGDFDAAASCYRRVIEESTTHTGRSYDSAVERLSRLEKAKLR